jgi:carboxymethylenebutenolidase
MIAAGASWPPAVRYGGTRRLLRHRMLRSQMLRHRMPGNPMLREGITMWNSFRTDDRDGLTAEVITYPGGNGDEIHAWVARPTGDGPFPGVVAVHHMPGWDEFYREFCERLARHGYTVICPDLYCRFGHGTPDDVAAIVRSQGGVHDASVVADCAAAADWLKALPTSNGKAGIIGTCSGGRHALLTASRVPGFDAVADLWGGGVIMAPEDLSEARPVAPIDYTAGLSAPLLGLFGNDDKHPTPEQVNQHEAELKRLGKTYDFYRYDDANHGFFYYQAPMYRPQQTMDGWEKIFTFFGQQLGG